MQDIEDSFSTKKKARVCLSNSQQPVTLYGIAASPASYCDCNWQAHGPHDLGDGGNRSFILTTGDNKQSGLRGLMDAVPQKSVLHPFSSTFPDLCLPTAASRKYAYADDTAIMHADGDWQAVAGLLSKDMATVDEHVQTRKFKIRTAKTVSAVFHLNNKEVKCELKVNFNNKTLPFCSEPTYLGHSLIVDADTSSSFAKSWHHGPHTWGGSLA